MFSALFRRAQVTVDNAIGHAINRIIVALPFLVAAAFGTAALTIRLTRELGPETGYLVLAGLFAIIGLIVAAVMYRSASPGTADGPAAVAATAADASAEESQHEPAAQAEDGLGKEDREMLNAALSAIGPLALPALLRLLVSNLPLIAALVATLFVFTRNGQEEASPTEPAQA